MFTIGRPRILILPIGRQKSRGTYLNLAKGKKTEISSFNLNTTPTKHILHTHQINPTHTYSWCILLLYIVYSNTILTYLLTINILLYKLKLEFSNFHSKISQIKYKIVDNKFHLYTSQFLTCNYGIYSIKKRLINTYKR